MSPQVEKLLLERLAQAEHDCAYWEAMNGDESDVMLRRSEAKVREIRAVIAAEKGKP